jgi:hypothetical protein
MKALLWLPLFLPVLGCEISPVVSGDIPSTRYDDCRHAAEDYCEHVVVPRVDEMKRCVAQHAFECVSSASDASQARPQT